MENDRSRRARAPAMMYSHITRAGALHDSVLLPLLVADSKTDYTGDQIDGNFIYWPFKNIFLPFIETYGRCYREELSAC